MYLTLKIDAEAKKENGSLSLWCVPNSFHTDAWREDTLNEIDWTRASSVDAGLVDGTFEDLPSDKERVSWTLLRDWYKGLGFTMVKELAYENYLDTSNCYRWEYRRRENLTDRSVKLQRYPLLFPHANASLHRGAADGVQTLTE
jgi:hypothetical protein